MWCIILSLYYTNLLLIIIFYSIHNSIYAILELILTSVTKITIILLIIVFSYFVKFTRNFCKREHSIRLNSFIKRKFVAWQTEEWISDVDISFVKLFAEMSPRSARRESLPFVPLPPPLFSVVSQPGSSSLSRSKTWPGIGGWLHTLRHGCCTRI